MSKKKSPSPFAKANSEYLKRIPDSEPVFVLRAQDQSAPDFIEQWAQAAHINGLDGEKYNEAMACAAEMREWPKRKAAD